MTTQNDPICSILPERSRTYVYNIQNEMQQTYKMSINYSKDPYVQMILSFLIYVHIKTKEKPKRYTLNDVPLFYSSRTQPNITYRYISIRDQLLPYRIL